MDFNTWLARVESGIKSDECEPAAWRPYFDAGLSPAEAVMQSRLDDAANP